MLSASLFPSPCIVYWLVVGSPVEVSPGDLYQEFDIRHWPVPAVLCWEIPFKLEPRAWLHWAALDWPAQWKNWTAVLQLSVAGGIRTTTEHKPWSLTWKVKLYWDFSGERPEWHLNLPNSMWWKLLWGFNYSSESLKHSDDKKTFPPAVSLLISYVLWDFPGQSGIH